jgi:hypothetical protein
MNKSIVLWNGKDFSSRPSTQDEDNLLQSILILGIVAADKSLHVQAKLSIQNYDADQQYRLAVDFGGCGEDLPIKAENEKELIKKAWEFVYQTHWEMSERVAKMNKFKQHMIDTQLSEKLC